MPLSFIGTRNYLHFIKQHCMQAASLCYIHLASSLCCIWLSLQNFNTEVFLVYFAAETEGTPGKMNGIRVIHVGAVEVVTVMSVKGIVMREAEVEEIGRENGAVVQDAGVLLAVSVAVEAGVVVVQVEM